MATTEALTRSSEMGNRPSDEEFSYRPLSMSAIAAAVLGGLSLCIFLAGNSSLQSAVLLSPIAMVGLLIGIRSLRTFRSMPGQLSGYPAALAGTILSLVGLVGGLAFAGFVHATEVPEGYARTSFAELRPDAVEERNGIPIPKNIQALEGEKVFIKGYMRSDSTPVRHNVKRFLLVRDNNQCCFGDINSVKFYDQMFVTMQGSLSTDYSTGLYRMGGTLRIHPENLSRGPGYPVYTLEADYVN